MSKRRRHTTTGSPYPLGASLSDDGVNFSLYSKQAERVDLLFFDTVDQLSPSQVVSLDPPKHKTYHYWHVWVPDVRPGQLYAYRVHGQYKPESGLRCDPSKVLLDPYGRAVAVPENYDRTALSRRDVSATPAMKSAVVDSSDYDWEGDLPLRTPSIRTILYELHVRGFTRNSNSKVSEDKRGTYAGLIEKIPYLVDLGVTAVELMPVFQFDPYDAPPARKNYWGYAPVSFFAPHAAYSSRQGPLGPITEFKDMVKALHRAGIEVILDVVYNHTAEGNHEGPTFCFRGIDNPTYYILEHDPYYYSNYSGTGNTLSANNPVVRRMIVDSLRYWVDEMHVDGFRFDLASILGRDQHGHVLANPPVLWDIESDPSLAGTKLIAEAWDAAGLYQVGSFVGDSWTEWNGKFRDDVRSFFRGDDGFAGRFADRFVGSPDVYQHKGREAEQSINFVTCHDGFTLNDLVSYSHKNNLANGEDNRDGCDDNRSFNCGHEGPTADPQVERLRDRQIKNFFTATLLSLGVPMILMGDEVRRTQGGNNNAYCHDDELNWLDWSLVEKHAGLLRFVKLLSERRLLRAIYAQERQPSLSELLAQATLRWSGVTLHEPDWGSNSHALALTAELKALSMVVHLMFNAYWEPLEFELPTNGRGIPLCWQRWIDTALESPHDITDWQKGVPLEGCRYTVEAHSVVVVASAISQ